MEEELIQQLQQELVLIKQRNAKVEADKAWETSYFRIVSICMITYIVAAVVMFLMGNTRFWLDALVPPIGFYLSTQSLFILKSWWIRARYNKMQKADS